MGTVYGPAGIRSVLEPFFDLRTIAEALAQYA